VCWRGWGGLGGGGALEGWRLIAGDLEFRPLPETWLTHMSDMTNSYMWHDSCICVRYLIYFRLYSETGLTHMSDTTHSCLIYMWDTTHSWLIQTHSYVRNDSFITDRFLRHDSLIRVTWLMSRELRRKKSAELHIHKEKYFSQKYTYT